MLLPVRLGLLDSLKRNTLMSATNHKEPKKKERRETVGAAQYVGDWMTSESAH